ncbi:MAG: DNA repair protein RadC, partial [Gammaproteobacteria bacterium]|nr:DNA repair protein RadC [Gammaproteobacteria bacterium]
MNPSKQDRFAGLKLSQLSHVEKESVVKLALKALAMKHRAGRTLSSPDATRDYLCLRLADYRNEVFGGLFLDNLCRIIAVRELFQG